MSPKIRLQKYISDCGVTSRRKAEQLMLEGLVKVNGKVVTVLGTKIDPDQDVVEVQGSLVSRNTVEKIYIVMNKPRAVMSTVYDPEGRPTIMDYCKEVSERVYPVGRLDYLSEGLMILTNDGELTNKILHPRYNIIKTYEVKVFGAVNERILAELKKERRFPEGKVRPLSVRVIKQLPTKTWLEFKLGEGRNREIRRICEEVGVTIDKLRRVAIEGLTVEGIAPGKYRFIDKNMLLKLLNMNEDGSSRSGNKFQFYSLKKSITKNKLRKNQAERANENKFSRYRKENYYETLKKQRERKNKADGEHHLPT